jgi:hypothetical protein
VASLASKVTTQSYILSLSLPNGAATGKRAAAAAAVTEQNLSLLYGCIKMLLTSIYISPLCSTQRVVYWSQLGSSQLELLLLL